MNKLDGLLVGISVSDAPDRARLGFPQREIDRAVLSLCTALVREGADIAYGGNLEPDGYTFKIFRHLASAFAGAREAPFRHFIPDPIARRARYEDLLSTLNNGRGTVRTEIARGTEFFVAVPRHGAIRMGADTVVRDDADLLAWFGEVPAVEPGAAYSAARQEIAARVDACVVLGGKMGVLSQPNDTYFGAMPGVAEEAILSLEACKPLIALGAFGGAARDIAIALGLIDPKDRVPRAIQNPSYAASINQVEALRHLIPSTLYDDLVQVADDDRSEQTAFKVVSIIETWVALPRKGGV